MTAAKDQTTGQDDVSRQEIERHLWAAIDLMAATLVKPDPRVWSHLLVYAPAPQAGVGREQIERVRAQAPDDGSANYAKGWHGACDAMLSAAPSPAPVADTARQ